MSRLRANAPIVLNLLPYLPSDFPTLTTTTTEQPNASISRARPVSMHSLSTPSNVPVIPRASSANLPNPYLLPPPGLTHSSLSTPRNPAVYPPSYAKPDPWLLISPRGQEELQKKAEAKGEWRYDDANGKQKKSGEGMWKYEEVNQRAHFEVAGLSDSAAVAPDKPDAASEEVSSACGEAEAVTESVRSDPGVALELPDEARSQAEKEILAQLQVAMAGMSIEQSNRKLSEVMVLLENGVGSSEILQYLADSPRDEHPLTVSDLQMPTPTSGVSGAEEEAVCPVVKGLEKAVEGLMLGVSPRFNPAVPAFIPGGVPRPRSRLAEIAAVTDTAPFRTASASSQRNRRNTHTVVDSIDRSTESDGKPRETLTDLIASSTDDPQPNTILTSAFDTAYEKSYYDDQRGNLVSAMAMNSYHQQIVHIQWETQMAWSAWCQYWAEEAAARDARAVKYAEDTERWLEMEDDEFCYFEQEEEV